MRIVNGLLTAGLLLLLVANLGEPEGRLLVPAFTVAVFWTGLATVFPAVMAFRPLVVLLSFSAAAILLGVFYFWPEGGGWMRLEAWRDGHAAGFLVAALSLLGPMLTSIRRERLRRQQRLEEKEARIAARHRRALHDGGGTAIDI